MLAGFPCQGSPSTALARFLAAVRCVLVGLALATLAGASFAVQDPGKEIPMEDLIDRPVSYVQTALGPRARYMAEDLRETSNPELDARVQWQYPLPGATLHGGETALVVVSKRVQVPELEGFDLRTAKSKLEKKGLRMHVSDLTCASGCHVPTDDELNGTVDIQCKAPGQFVEINTYVCVVVAYPPPPPSTFLMFALATAALILFVAAVALWFRLRFVRDELRIMRARPPEPRS